MILEVRLKFSKVALEDAAHCSLREDDLATLGALLVRDPTAGRKDGNGNRVLSWRATFKVKYLLHFAPDDAMVIYVMRILAKTPAPRNLGELGRMAKDISVHLVKKKLEKLTEQDE